MTTLIILCSLGLICLFAEILGFKKLLFAIVMIGLASAFVANANDWDTNQVYFNHMMIVDNFAVAFVGLIIGIAFLWLLLPSDFFKDNSNKSDHFSLILFALIGAFVMATYANLIMLFLGIEILSISLYILAGSNKKNLASNEAALKYFLMGAFATGFLLFGIALLYGATGSFNLDSISLALNGEATTTSSTLVMAGILMILIALAFKIGAVPFHFWVPDVYQGSPTIITAFMSTVVKIAAFAAFFRLFVYSFQASAEFWSTTLWVLAASTILLGNLVALYQKNIKRMLAYSSIAHAGYMILAILAMNSSSASALLYYAFAYSVSSISAFGILLIVSQYAGNDNIESFVGLAKKNSFLAVVTIIAMLSLAGIPPTAGFFAKYYIFSAALQNHFIALVIIAVLGSLIGVYYYFRIIISLFQENESTSILSFSLPTRGLLIFTSILVLLFGIIPGIIVGIL